MTLTFTCLIIHLCLMYHHIVLTKKYPAPPLRNKFWHMIIWKIHSKIYFDAKYPGRYMMDKIDQNLKLFSFSFLGMQSFNIVNFGVNLLTATVSQNFEEEEKFTIHTIYQKYQMISLLFLFIHKCNCPAISMTIDVLGLFIYNCHLKLLLYCKSKAGQGEIRSCELVQFFTKTFFFLFLSFLYLGKIFHLYSTCANMIALRESECTTASRIEVESCEHSSWSSSGTASENQSSWTLWSGLPEA